MTSSSKNPSILSLAGIHVTNNWKWKISELVVGKLCCCLLKRVCKAEDMVRGQLQSMFYSARPRD